MTAGPLTRPNDASGGWLRPGVAESGRPRRIRETDQLTPTIGRRSAPGASSGTTGFFGSTGVIRR